VELLVALAIVTIFAGGALATFVQILRASEVSERMIERYENARAALEVLSKTIKAAQLRPGQGTQAFKAVNVPLNVGDGIDNDKDGFVDEEAPNGLDDDGDFALGYERHAPIGLEVERAALVGQPDLGDEKVDEDTVFHQDRLAVTLAPDPANPGVGESCTTFTIGTFEGEPNVLLVGSQALVGTLGTQADVGPLAHNIVGLNFLFWDPNQSPPRWVETWDADMWGKGTGPGIELPASVFIEVTVYTGAEPLSRLKPGKPMETLSACTVVNIESVLRDPRYENYVRPKQ
jgi:hypothetical protein